MKRLILYAVSLSLFSFLYFAAPLHAQSVPPGCPGGPAGPAAPGVICPDGSTPTPEPVSLGCQPGDGGGFLGFPTWYKYLDNAEIIGGRCSPIVTFPDDITKILLAIFEIILRAGGLLAVIFVIWGAFQYQTSQGDPEKTKNARSTITNALIGIAVTISAVAIVNLIARGIT